MVGAVFSRLQPAEQAPVTCNMSSDTAGLGKAGNCRKDINELRTTVLDAIYDFCLMLCLFWEIGTRSA